MKINNFRGELTDISAKKEALILPFVGLKFHLTMVDDIRTNVPRDARYYFQKMYHNSYFCFDQVPSSTPGAL